MSVCVNCGHTRGNHRRWSWVGADVNGLQCLECSCTSPQVTPSPLQERARPPSVSGLRSGRTGEVEMFLDRRVPTTTDGPMPEFTRKIDMEDG